jgi:glycosyltransferase involved in cell wall biosynthesis
LDKENTAMNILISSYSCNPYLGSEDGVGWNWLLQYSKHAKPGDHVYVITKKFNEEAMRKGIAEFGLDNVTLWISEPPYYLDWFREKHSMFHHMYYSLWQRYAYRYVKKQNISFDVIHHVTMTDWRFAGAFSKFKNAYTIFGPVGGGQEIPKALKGYQTKHMMEMIRTVANRTRKYLPGYRSRIKAFDVIYAVNHETKKYLQEIVDMSKIHIEPDCAIAESYKNIVLPKKDKPSRKFIFSGRYDLPRKGVMFLIEALSYLPKDFEYEIDFYGGPMDCTLKNIIQKAGLEGRLRLCGRLPYMELREVYSHYDALLFSSIIETSGNVLVEAMANGLPVVGIDTSFSSLLNANGCGIFVNPNVPLEELKQSYANAMVQLFADADYHRYSANAYHYANSLTWEKKYETVYEAIHS